MIMNIEWSTINIIPPKLDAHIVARSSDEFGWGCTIEIFELDSKKFTEEEAIMHLENHGFIEWLELPK